MNAVAQAPPALGTVRRGVQLASSAAARLLLWWGVGLAATLAAATVLCGLAGLGRPSELEYGEAIIYSQVTRVLRGEPLYQPLDGPPYTVAAYTPVYYWLAALARLAAGPGFGPGRAISLLSGLAIACLVARFSWRLTGSKRAATLGAVTFLALGLPWHPAWTAPWSALYKEDVLGAAFAVAAIGLLWERPRGRSVVIAGLLAGLAVLTKQTLVASLIAGFAWLWLRDRRAAVLYGAAGTGLVAGCAVVLETTTGAFVANTVSANANPFSALALLANGFMLLLYQLAPAAGAAWLLCSAARLGYARRDFGPLPYYLGACCLPLLGLAKVGSNHNYWIELAAATAALSAASVWASLERIGPPALSAPRLPYVALAASPALWLNTELLVFVLVSPDHHLRAVSGQRHGPAFSALVQRVSRESGVVLAEPLDVVALAGQPIYLEPYVYGIMARHGQWDPAPVVQRICAGDVALVVTETPLSDSDHKYHGYDRWPTAVRDALRRAMRLDSEVAGRYLYVPREVEHRERCP